MQEEDYSAWLGKSVIARDYISASPIDRLAATLDKEEPPAQDGDAIPYLAHWLYFLPAARQSELGPDGHPRRGGFLPPVHHLPRRMWAGGRFRFLGPLCVGTQAERRSTIRSIKSTAGKSGPLVFVTVEHRVGLQGQGALVTEEHDIVYRSAESAAATAGFPKTPSLVPRWERSLIPDEVLLFRYSALTFNGHRIHYDQPYVTGEEHYPGLIVHGPLMATLLIDLLAGHVKPHAIREFSFRSMSPLFSGNRLDLHATEPDDDGRCTLWASTDENRLIMQAEAKIG